MWAFHFSEAPTIICYVFFSVIPGGYLTGITAKNITNKKQVVPEFYTMFTYGMGWELYGSLGLWPQLLPQGPYFS
jgi:hypothetical protein